MPFFLKSNVIVPVPVFDAVAVKVTGVPGQIAPGWFVLIITAGVRLGLTTTVIGFDKAVLAVKQFPPVIVIIQDTTSLEVSVVVL